MPLNRAHQDCLRALAEALVDQHRARVLVEPNRRASGFWFGGGNVVADAQGTLWLCGRYRNAGDSRLGLEAGERGLACAVFASRDGGHSFAKVRQWSKADLSRPDAPVVSIEGTALYCRADGTWELYVSSEKAWEYPEGLEAHRKPGCGIWSIDVMVGPAPDALDAGTLRSVLREQEDAAYLHAKDPVVYRQPDGGTHLVYCTHPYCWSSANTALAVRRPGREAFEVVTRQLVPRGPAWDVASTRVTCRLAGPAGGPFRRPSGHVAAVLRWPGVRPAARAEPARCPATAGVLLRGTGRRAGGPRLRVPAGRAPVVPGAAVRLSPRDRLQPLRRCRGDAGRTARHLAAEPG